ncbi:MAG: hypothetical protein SV760_05355 [Halobacteria archaeon]|nr:hypothetical protein [Halobacteria archaeon]
MTGSERLAYVAGIAASSFLVAGAFSVWRKYFYRKRSQYLFKSTRGDDQVLVPIRGSDAETDKLVGFAARMAAAHDSGKVVLMKTVSEEVLENKQTQIEETSSEEISDEEIAQRTEEEVSEQVVDELRKIQSRIEEEFGVPCEIRGDGSEVQHRLHPFPSIGG